MISEDQHVLTCLAEECAEVAQRVTKALRFGLNEVQPGQQLTNAERITVELNDLLGVADMLFSRGVIPEPNPEAVLAKEGKVERFMAYARTQGALA